MAEATAREVADAILAVSQSDDEYITNLKLQKLLYYAQGWHLAEHGRPLFDDPIEAWPRGPVVSTVFRHFKRFTWQPVELDDQPCDVSRYVLNHAREVWERYGCYTGRELEVMTTSETPWRSARRGVADDDPDIRRIDPTVMAAFFHHEAAAVARQDAAHAQA